MSELQDARQKLDLAEQAAIKGDFSSADELLRHAARIQEAELGPLHPDLANTINSLAIVAERTGRLADAEMFYRRTVVIASASLPADDPIVAESRKNLEDFCRERGVPIAEAVVTTPAAQDTVQPLPPAPRRSSRQLLWVAIGAIVVVAVAVRVGRPWSPRETSTTAPTASQSTVPAPTPPDIPAPTEQTLPTTVAPQVDDPAVVTDKPPSSAPSSGAISLATAQLCQTFSTGGGGWQCDPPGDTVGPGSIVLFTRVRSPRDALVVHRWYRDDVLRQAVTLAIRANASEGYRTYSRQTVSVGNWRAEVRSADGDLLHEQRFAVR